MSEIREHMKVIGKDGVSVGTVDKVEGDRIKLTKKDSPEGHKDHHHYIDKKLVGSVEGEVVKLSLNADARSKARGRCPLNRKPFGRFFVRATTLFRSQEG